MTEVMIMDADYDDGAESFERIVAPIAAKWFTKKVDFKTGDYDFYQRWSPTKPHEVDYIRETFKEHSQLRQLLFLLTHCHAGDMAGGVYETQRFIIELANTFGIDYRLLDAEERVEISSKKNKPVYEAYLAAVQAGDVKATIPRMLSTNYSKSKADDALLVPKKAASKPVPKAKAKTAKKGK